MKESTRIEKDDLRSRKTKELLNRFCRVVKERRTVQDTVAIIESGMTPRQYKENFHFLTGLVDKIQYVESRRVWQWIGSEDESDMIYPLPAKTPQEIAMEGKC